MTEPNLERLAEVAAEFLGWRKSHGIEVPDLILEFSQGGADEYLQHLFFEQQCTAPILMHLAQEKLEKMGYEIRIDNLNKGIWKGKPLQRETRVFIRRDNHEDSQRWDWQLAEIHKSNESRFIAFWMAVESAMKGEK